ncbi:hypothetical protein ACSBLW_03025 [Thioclava sp. FR2]|uniref:hypothetical protein n=1 Tax=Thioclava sp. FR2 TaxID=3445780 RepID=UPI003EBAFC35
MMKILFPAQTGFATPFAPADSARAASGADTMVSPVLEMVSFRLEQGATDTAFLAAAKATEAPLRCQPGFLRRSLVGAPDGTWTDLVEWTDMGAAQAGAQAMMAEPAFQPFMALIDMGSVSMGHPVIRWRMD